jgi:hypothetical protein
MNYLSWAMPPEMRERTVSTFLRQYPIAVSLFRAMVMVKHMDSTTRQSSRPSAVNLAIVLLLVNVGASLVLSALRTSWNSPFVYVKFVCELLMLAVPIWFICRGKNWARWLLVAFAFGGFGLSFPSLIEHFQARSGSWIVTYCWRNLIDVIAVVLLFHPHSGEWFRGATNVTTA